jgi:hypothetical protein
MTNIVIDVGEGTSDQNAKTLIIKQLSKQQINERFFSQGYDGLEKTRNNGFVQIQELDVSTGKGGMGKQTKLTNGIRWTIERQLAVPSEDYQRFVRIIIKALTALTQNDEILNLLKENALEFLMTEKNGSAGYVVMDTPIAPRKMRMYCGKDLWGKGVTKTSIVGNFLYKAVSGSDDAKSECRILAMVFHEFGHLLHQMMSASHYFALGALGVLQSKHNSEFPTHRFLYLFSNGNQIAMKAFHEGIKKYAALHVGVYASDREPEIVAEIFSGLMMGVVYEKGAMDIYEAFGGFLPPKEMRYEQKEVGKLEDIMQQFNKQIIQN